MKKIIIKDSVNINKSSRVITDEGYLKGNMSLTCVGIQQYYLSDFTGLTADKETLINVFRPAETIFSEETKDSIKLKPVTMLHPGEMVSSGNYKDYVVGNIGENIYKLEDKLCSNFQILDKNIINEIDNGKKEISLGYSANIIKKSGIYDNKIYEYVFDGDMLVNHVAIVPKGRCGKKVSIMDERIGEIMVKELEDSVTEEVVNSIEEVSLEESPPVENDDARLIEEVEGHELVQEVEVEGEVKSLKVEDSVTIVDQEVIIHDAVIKRISVMDKARLMLKDESIDLSKLSIRQILDKALHAHEYLDISSKSQDYLTGLLDGLVENKKTIKKQFESINDSFTSISTNRSYTALEIQKLK